MPAGKPATDVEWADGGGAVVTNPALGYKQTGWVAGTAPPAGYMNWWMNLVYQWEQYLRDFEIQAHTWTVQQVFNVGALATSAANFIGGSGGGGQNAATFSGTGAGSGVNANGGATGAGGTFNAGGASASGVDAFGALTGAGVFGRGGSTSGPGIRGDAAASYAQGAGVAGNGQFANNAGVVGTAGPSGNGVVGLGFGVNPANVPNSNAGVYGIGGGATPGVIGTAAPTTAGNGVVGLAAGAAIPAAASAGVAGVGIGAGAGVQGVGGASGPGVLGTSVGTLPGVQGTATAGNVAGGLFSGFGNGPGVQGSGGTTGPGGYFQSGGGGRGAVSMAPQAAPGAPIDGDLWVENAGSLKVRNNGATRFVTEHEGVQALTYVGNWSSGGSPVQFFRDAFGVVHLYGIIQSTVGADATTVGTLPAGYRPITIRQFPCGKYTSAFAMIVVTISTAGVISLASTTRATYNANDQIVLDGITFEAV